MDIDRDDHDPDLTRMLRAVRADADPALWTRARARIEARRPVPALLAFAMRPVALAASFALLVASATLAFTIAGGSANGASDDYASLGDALIAEREAESQVSAPAAPAGGAARDSGSGM